jgi:hypothetical protein
MIQNTLYNDILILNASFNGIIHYLKQHERLKDIQKLYILVLRGLDCLVLRGLDCLVLRGLDCLVLRGLDCLVLRGVHKKCGYLLTYLTVR